MKPLCVLTDLNQLIVNMNTCGSRKKCHSNNLPIKKCKASKGKRALLHSTPIRHRSESRSPRRAVYSPAPRRHRLSGNKTELR